MVRKRTSAGLMEWAEVLSSPIFIIIIYRFGLTKDVQLVANANPHHHRSLLDLKRWRR